MLVTSPSEVLKEHIADVRSQLVSHPLYAKINSLEDIQKFMSTHVFAVWDFMSLLKSLQRNLTCVAIPWRPVADANTSYLINEIVLGEESDVDEKGTRTSHFQLYLKAMHQVGADDTLLKALFEKLDSGNSVKEAISTIGINQATQNFLNFTFDIIEDNKPHVLAAVFTYGREDLIPDMFLSIVKDLEAKFPAQLSVFKYYLERHIEVDGEHHSILAYEMTESLCKTEEQWEEATTASRKALELRVALWDSVLETISR
ncbi:MAG: DUF3050 domain-containing protein [Bacteroidetes bacterium]|nr:DUF3050 domain-containing protein [Bacteroidota bacterium]MBU1371345.1 DUF3050 domain-containing protein [Bacteroidota bacterium]MBU1485832.1 DUF3050 domain-containing protein [Bacteroidota bacterium]MBU1761088.1 DUF3050 domain-containing protein [Bacteroidota bacterium]MBU2046803.1 DUF3050 domain-containing protein [Bacteroidota bacterium]